MSKAFLQLLVGLAEDPLRAREFRDHPEALLGGAGLSEEEEQAVRGRDASRIRALLAEEPPEHDLMLLTWLGSILEDHGEE